MPAPDAGNDPNLTVVPERTRRSPSELNTRQEAELSKAMQLCAAAQKPEFAPVLAARGIDADFLTTLVNDIKATIDQSRLAAQCTHAKEGCTRAQGAAGEQLVKGLRVIQSAARQQHLPANPEKVKDYYVGERLHDSRATLESISQNIINQANEERPPGINTEFIQRVALVRQAYVDAQTTKRTEGARAKQQRAQRNEMVKSIKARRQRIQRAADSAWPPGETPSAQARTEFQLPPDRPYSY
jgi:hypothetical protein